MMVDSHQHFWHLDRGDYRFPTANDGVIWRDFMPDDLRPLLRVSGVSRTILVQATDTVAESRFLLDIARDCAFVAGVVGWWDGATPGLLDELLDNPNGDLLVGVRPMLQRFDDVSWLVRPETLVMFDRLVARNLVLDALVDIRHLATVRRLCTERGDLKVVIDHMAKPWRSPERCAEWENEMSRLAVLPNCWVKLSGFPFAQADRALSFEHLVAKLRGWFPAERLVWGSDWPVVCREGGYAVPVDAIRNLFVGDAAPLVLSENAVSLYGLNPQ